jgi:hypothetical protein
MPQTIGLSSVGELFAKLARDADLLDVEVSSDHLFNFVVTGYPMIDWVKKDPSVPASAKAANEVNLLYGDPGLKVCGDLATACKHFSLTQRVPDSSRLCFMRRVGDYTRSSRQSFRRTPASPDGPLTCSEERPHTPLLRVLGSSCSI